MVVKRVWLFSLSFVMLFAVFVVPISAQKNDDDDTVERITMSPAISKPSLKAGEKVTGKLTVINDGSIDYTFLMYSRPFSVNGENYDTNYTTVNKQTEAYQWVNFDRSNVRLKAGERTEIGYTVQTPKDARAGGHYAVLFAETQPPEGDPASVARKKRIGTLLYMTVDGDLIEKGKVESWQADLIQTKPPLNTDLRLKNDGNVHFQADLSASYTNIFGKKRFTLNQELLILPGTTRRIPITWQDSPYLGIYKVSGNVSFLNKKESLPEKYVVLLPMPVLASVAGIVAIVIISTVFKKKRANKSKKSRAKAKKS